MKKITYLCAVVLLAAVTFSSCKKSSTPPPATIATSMKLTSNGTALSFSDCLEASVSVNDITQTAFIGTNIINGKLSDVSFEVDIVHDPATLKAGQTYQAGSSFAKPDGAYLFYYTNDTDSFVTQPANPQGSVTITEVTSTTISGTFSGKLFASDDFSGTTVVYTITNGSFTAKINNK